MLFLSLESLTAYQISIPVKYLFGLKHRSAEHAYQYVKAKRSGDISRATEIQSALDAKKIGNMVTPSPSFTDNPVSLMTEIIEAKA